jgi:hypothetical protein
MATPATSSRRSQPRGRNPGRARALAAAFGAAEQQPALRESRERALEELNRGRPPPHEVAAVVETGVGLTCAIIRAAGHLQSGSRIGSVVEAVERLGPGGMVAVLRSVPSYDIFNGDGRLALSADRSRLHALAVGPVTERVWRRRSSGTTPVRRRGWPHRLPSAA